MAVIGQYKLDTQDISAKGADNVAKGHSWVNGQRVEVHGNIFTNEVWLKSNGDVKPVFGRACFFDGTDNDNRGKATVGQTGNYTVFAGVLENVDFYNNSSPLLNDEANANQVTLIRKGCVRNSQVLDATGAPDTSAVPKYGDKVFAYTNNGVVTCGATVPNNAVEIGVVITVLENNSYIYSIEV